jgi:hypothetical protein
MIQKKLLKLAVVGLTAGLFFAAQSAQTNKEIPQPKKEVVSENDVQLSKAEPASDQKEVALMKGTKEPIADMQKVDSQESCSKPVCKSPECTPVKPCKACSKCEPKPCTQCEPKACHKCEPKGCTKEPTPPKKCIRCEEKPCGCKKCEDAPKSNSKGAAKTAVEG